MKVSKLNSVDFDNITLIGIEEVWGFDRGTGQAVFAFDQIKSGELSGNNDVSYAEGKRGVRLATMKKNKTSSFTCENGYVVFSALGRQLGAEVERAYGATERTLHTSEKLKCNSEKKLVISHEVESSQAKALQVFKMQDGVVVGEALEQAAGQSLEGPGDYYVDSDNVTIVFTTTYGSQTPQGTMFMVEYDYTSQDENAINVARTEYLEKTTSGGNKLTLSATPVTGTFKIYSVNQDKTIKLPLLTSEYTQDEKTVTLKGKQESMPAGTVYLVTYDEAVTSAAKRIVNDGETFSDDVRLVINMLGQDVCSGLQYLVQCIMPKATVSGEWNLSLGTDPAVHNFSAEASLDICSIDKELCEFIVC